MLMRHSLIFISTLFTLWSCNSNDKPPQKEAKQDRRDSIELARQRDLQNYLAEEAAILKLSPINKGVDSFELRLWVSSMLVEHDLILLSYKDSAWQSFKIRYFRSEDGVTHFKKKEIKSAFSAIFLADSLKQIDFANMPSQENIKNFVDDVADGVTYNLEIATKYSYKLITYHCPEHFAKSESNNKKFLDLILLLDRHFRFWSPICSI
jgi:hypothetical protein